MEETTILNRANMFLVMYHTILVQVGTTSEEGIGGIIVLESARSVFLEITVLHRSPALPIYDFFRTCMVSNDWRKI